MREEESIVGYYGKIPSKGDFVTQTLPKSFTDPWDAWLRQVLAYSKSELGDQWMEYYLTSPLYHFVLSSGICGNQSWLGVMIPSVDNVGRFFPMTICKSFSETSNSLDLIEKNNEWLAKAEKLLLSCLDEDFNLSNFESELLKLKENEDSDSTITLKRFTMNRFQDSAWNFPIHKKESLGAVYPELINSMLNTFYSTYSVWHTAGSDIVTSGFVISEGLPSHKSMTAFMDGQWGKRGWSNEQVIR